MSNLTLEFHYVLKEKGDHSLDAFVLNRAEHELLMLARRVTEIFDVQATVELEPLKEGGIRSLWKISNANVARLSLLVAVISLVLNETKPLFRDDSLDKLKKRELELRIKKHEMKIEQLRLKIIDLKNEDVAVVGREAAEVVKKDPPIIYHRSAFYEKMLETPKVTAVCHKAYVDQRVLVDEVKVARNDFSKFILSETDFPRVEDESARIEIVAPVLKGGRIKWKGIYDGRAIEFRMHDVAFRKQVESREIVFRAGFIIECALSMRRRMTESGEAENTDYTVVAVLGTNESGRMVQTPRGKRFRARKLSELSQMELIPREKSD